MIVLDSSFLIAFHNEHDSQHETANAQAQPQLDELDRKLAQAFPGRVVRKDRAT